MSLEESIASSRRTSFWLSLGFPLGLLMLWVFEATHTPDPAMTADHAQAGKLLLSVLIAAGATAGALVTGCVPLAFGDRRPLWWLIPMALGWCAFLTLYDWRSLLS